jgi:hypothetical protein
MPGTGDLYDRRGAWFRGGSVPVMVSEPARRQG